MIVEPERLEPGIKARTCANPTANASPIFRFSIVRLRLPTNSANASRIATTIIMVAIIQRFFVKVPSIWCLNNKPTTATGMEPIITSHPSQASCESRLPEPELLVFFSRRRRHTRLQGDWSSDVCSSDLSTNVELEPRTSAQKRTRHHARAFVE